MGCSKKKLLVCVNGKSCLRKDGPELYKFLKKTVSDCDLNDRFKIKKADCLGLCRFAPVIAVRPDGASYGRLSEQDVIRITLRHSKEKKPIKELAVGKKRRKD